MLKTDTIQDITVVQFENVSRFNALAAESVKEQLKQFYQQPHTKLILNLKTIPTLDTSDALATAICHLNWSRHEGK